MRNGKPIHLKERTSDSVFSIVSQYQQEFRGVAEYYQLAYNRSTRIARLKWIMERSLTKTLANKLRTRVPKVYNRFGTIIQTGRGSYKGLEVRIEREGKKPLVAQWGGISLARNKEAVLNDHPYRVWNDRTEVEERLLASICELCGSTENVEVHHIRALKDLQRKGRAEKPEWVKRMASRHRKTLVVCHNCHARIHDGKSKRSKAPCSG